MIREAYVSFETAKLLKEKGFDEPINRFYELSTGKPLLVRSEYCRNRYTVSFAAPTHQMACAWLREKGYHIYTFKGVDSWVYEVQSLNEDWTYHLGGFEDHDDAIEAALKYCLKNLL